jgi:hypothetical protein
MNIYTAPDSEGADSMRVPSSWKATTPSKFFGEKPHPRQAGPYPQRKPQPLSMSPETHAWLGRLPPRFQPMTTARRHPHIVNRLCEVWNQPASMADYLQSLLLSSRPGRTGFSFDVLGELVDLQSYYDDLQNGIPVRG